MLLCRYIASVNQALGALLHAYNKVRWTSGRGRGKASQFWTLLTKWKMIHFDVWNSA